MTTKLRQLLKGQGLLYFATTKRIIHLTAFKKQQNN